MPRKKRTLTVEHRERIANAMRGKTKTKKHRRAIGRGVHRYHEHRRALRRNP